MRHLIGKRELDQAAADVVEAVQELGDPAGWVGLIGAEAVIPGWTAAPITLFDEDGREVPTARFSRTTAGGQTLRLWVMGRVLPRLVDGVGDDPSYLVDVSSRFGRISLQWPSQGTGWYTSLRGPDWPASLHTRDSRRDVLLDLASRPVVVQVDPEFRNLANSVRAQLCEWALARGEEHGVELAGMDFPHERDARPTE